jgi:hypothetical protein
LNILTRPGLVLTPTGLTEGLGLAGAARLAGYTVGCSRWASEHDKLLALIVLYSLQYEVRLHHVGTRFPTNQEFEEASAEFSDSPIYVSAPDHVRHYHHVESPLSPNGEYWVEYQHFPSGPFTPAAHWDLATSNPHGLLLFVADAFEQKPVFFENPGKNDPVGVVWVTSSSGAILGVMARDRWGDPADWAKAK